MKISYSQFQQLFSNLNWDISMCAEKLTAIGHETEIDGEILDIKLTANRTDCKDVNFLAFDLAAIFTDLQLKNPISLNYNDRNISIDVTKINKILGSDFTSNELQALENLGFKISGDQIEVPSHRVDVTNIYDLAEEMLRIYGVKRINIQQLSALPAPESAGFQKIQNIKQTLTSLGFNETVTNTFTSSGTVELKNPFSSDLPYLQSDLVNGLLLTLAKNPFLKKAMFFQVANIFYETEDTILGIIISGYKNIDEIVSQLESKLSTKLNSKAIDSLTLNKFDIKSSNVVYLSTEIKSINVESAVLQNSLARFKPISKFPPLVRDLTVNADDITDKVNNLFENVLFVEKIDSYEHPQTGIINNTFRIYLQKFNESFNQEEIAKIDQLLAKEFMG